MLLWNFVWCRYRFRPRVLHDVSKINLRVQLQGEWVESPVGVAPTAMQKMAQEEGEAATAQGQYTLFPLSPPLCAFIPLSCLLCLSFTYPIFVP